MTDLIETPYGDDVILQILDRGLPGPQGPQGEQGDIGPVGSSSEFVQSVASTTWTVNHNLGFWPVVTLMSEGGQQMWADILHTSVNQFVVTFNTATAGKAHYV